MLSSITRYASLITEEFLMHHKFCLFNRISCAGSALESLARMRTARILQFLDWVKTVSRNALLRETWRPHCRPSTCAEFKDADPRSSRRRALPPGSNRGRLPVPGSPTPPADRPDDSRNPPAPRPRRGPASPRPGPPPAARRSGRRLGRAREAEMPRGDGENRQPVLGVEAHRLSRNCLKSAPMGHFDVIA